MRIVIQRVANASVSVDGETIGAIERGLLILVGVEDADTHEDVTWLAKKAVSMRLFDDAQGVMNLSLKEIEGEALVISQFTLQAQVKKGNRPSYIKASKPPHAVPLYEDFCQEVSQELGRPVATGRFGADMKVSLLNDGPVTIWVDSKNKE